MGKLREVDPPVKINWWFWSFKLWVAISVLARILSSGNASAQLAADNIIINSASQCGFSISGGYAYGNKNNQDIINNNNTNTNNNTWQVVTTLNTNPCTNQSDLEKIRQENESKREIIRQENESKREIIRQENEKQREAIRTYSQIMNTCINARVQAVQKDINPDIICNITQLQNSFGNVLPSQKN